MFKNRLVLIGAALLLAAGLNHANAAPAPDKVTAQDHVMGSANAPVTTIEYFAQACSVCARFDMEVFPQLKAKYIDTGKVRYVMRLFPLFPIDGPSYKLALCVPPDQFFHATDVLFRSQPQWDSAEYPGADPASGLMQAARALGVSEAKAKACMTSSAEDAAINQVAKDGFERYQISGTPTIVINFKKVEMQRNSWEETQAAIEAALAAKTKK